MTTKTKVAWNQLFYKNKEQEFAEQITIFRPADFAPWQYLLHRLEFRLPLPLLNNHNKPSLNTEQQA